MKIVGSPTVRWFGLLMALGLLAVALLSLPFKVYAVQTGSMEPAFAPRSAVLIHEGEYIDGEPVTFAHHEVVITHRLMSENEDGSFVTKGDANATPDPWTVQPTEVIGGVVASAPHVGYWLVYLKSLPGMLSVLFAVGALVIVWPIVRDLDERRSSNAAGA